MLYKIKNGVLADVIFNGRHSIFSTTDTTLAVA